MATIGILALQGDFEKHVNAVNKCGHKALLVKDSNALKSCSKLIIPGGESTTFIKLIDRLKLREAIIDFGHEKAIFGTCAGLIILASDVNGNPFKSLGLIDLKVERNAYGRQINSFIDNIHLSLNGTVEAFEAVFIRAPKIAKCLGATKPLAYHGKDIVLAMNKNILVATFHPELTDDLRIHNFFLNHFA